MSITDIASGFGTTTSTTVSATANPFGSAQSTNMFGAAEVDRNILNQIWGRPVHYKKQRVKILKNAVIWSLSHLSMFGLIMIIENKRNSQNEFL